MTKYNLHAELRTRYKEYFESKLAVSLLHKRKLFPSVEKISSEIVRLMLVHKTKIIRIIENDAKISEELYGQHFFGRLDLDKTNLSAHETWENMLGILMQLDSLDKIMQVHSIFMYRIAKHLNLSASNKIPMLNLNDRGRKEATNKINSLSDALGVTKNKVYSKLLNSSTYTHSRGIDKFIPDLQSRFFKNMEQKQIPFAAGLSAHTATLISGAMRLGLQKKHELKEYLLACFVFLAAGGNHSFHEVMSVGKQIGINYGDGDYMSCLPDSFINTDVFKQLKQMFPDLLEDESYELDISDEKMAESVFGQNIRRQQHFA